MKNNRLEVKIGSLLLAGMMVFISSVILTENAEASNAVNTTQSSSQEGGKTTSLGQNAMSMKDKAALMSKCGKGNQCRQSRGKFCENKEFWNDCYASCAKFAGFMESDCTKRARRLGYLR